VCLVGTGSMTERVRATSDSSVSLAMFLGTREGAQFTLQQLGVWKKNRNLGAIEVCRNSKPLPSQGP
jgi:hypothetical protein